MLKVDYQKIGEELQTAAFATENDRDLFLNGEAAYDIKDYWISLDGGRVLRVYED